LAGLSLAATRLSSYVQNSYFEVICQLDNTLELKKKQSRTSQKGLTTLVKKGIINCYH